MNKQKVKKILMRYFYIDNGNYYPSFNSDCLQWNKLFNELFGE